jgi:copper chaperone
MWEVGRFITQRFGKETAMIELNVNGMTCGHCASTVTRAIKSVDPEADVHVDLEGKRVHVESRRPGEALAKAVTAAGYPAAPAGTQAPAPAKRRGCCG